MSFADSSTWNIMGNEELLDSRDWGKPLGLQGCPVVQASIAQ